MTSRRKGRYYENEFAKRYAGKRISETGMPGPDIQLPAPTVNIPWTPEPTKWEIKYRERIATLNWWDQATNEGADYLAIRRSGDTNWYIVHPVTTPCPCPLEEK